MIEIRDPNEKIIEKIEIEDWYEKMIEEPLKDLVKLLRNNGFNTFCSCGHKPSPYIQMEWYDDLDITRLYSLLIENGYFGFVIEARWEYQNESSVLQYVTSHRIVNLTFNIGGEGLATIQEIKKGVK